MSHAAVVLACLAIGVAVGLAISREPVHRPLDAVALCVEKAESAEERVDCIRAAKECKGNAGLTRLGDL